MADSYRALRNGEHLLKTAKSMGWDENDAEGPFNFITRHAYELGQRDLEPELDRLRTLMQVSSGSFVDLVLEGLLEARRAMVKYPQPNYVITKIAEEAGEVVGAAIHCAEGRDTKEHIREEMRQLIAMLYRLWVEGDQVHGLSPVSET
jgi:hypothetical protein